MLPPWQRHTVERMALFMDRAGLRMDLDELMIGLRVWGIAADRDTVERLRTAVLRTVGVVSPNPLCACPCYGVDRLHTVSSALRAACARQVHWAPVKDIVVIDIQLFYVSPRPRPSPPFELTYWGLLRRGRMIALTARSSRRGSDTPWSAWHCSRTALDCAWTWASSWSGCACGALTSASRLLGACGPPCC